MTNKGFTPLHPESRGLQTADEWQVKFKSTRRPRPLGRGVTGFTLLEILVVLVVLGFLTAMVAGRFRGMREEAAITITLSEMKEIKEAIRDRFYPDLGLIPEDTTNPKYATRYLCLIDDGAGPPIGPERQEMLDFLTAGGVPHLINWDRYSRRGWRGPYLEREVIAFVAGKWYPLIIDPWGRSVDHSVEPDGVLGEYRILGGQNRAEARIVSFGANGVDNGGGRVTLPLPADTGDDLVMFIFGTGAVRRP